MKLLLTVLILLFTINNYNAQTTLIPDAEFEELLILYGYDTLPIDGSVPTANIDTLTYLNIASPNFQSLVYISDLTGLEDFVSLKKLRVNDTEITSLNLSQNTDLIYFELDGTELVALNIMQNVLLDTLEFRNANHLANIDLTGNTNLSNLYLKNSLLTTLDLSQNINLIHMNLGNNPSLSCINLKNGNNLNIDLLELVNVNSLTCVQVDDSIAGIPHVVSTAPLVNWTENCGYSCNLTTSIPKYQLNDKISIYPNPTSSQLFLDTEFKIKNIKVIDINGKVIKLVNKEQYKVDISELSIGIYYLKFETEQSVFVKKFVKQ